MFHNRACPAILVIAALVVSSSAEAQQTVGADQFVDSAGVNVHLHYDRTIYADEFPLIKSRLLELGVRHVRDGLVDSTWRVYYDRHNELGRAGIKGLFIAGPNATEQLLAEFPGRMSDSFEAYEAPNEYDRSNDPNWVQTMTQVLTRLRNMRNVPAVAHFPVLGASLVDEGSYAALGDLSHLFDAGNLHNYFGGRHPGTTGWGSNGYGSIAWNLNLVRQYAGGKPIITTETGYKNDPSLIDRVPQEVAGRYMPRVLLEQFRAGILRTYIYELVDHPTSKSHGILNPDGSPKPAFTAVKSLLGLLTDPGPAFTPQNLSYTVQGTTADVRHMAFQKRDGTYLLAVWVEKSSYNVDTNQAIPVPAQAVTVALPSPMRHVRTHRWQLDGSLSTASASATLTSVPLTVTDALTMIELIIPPPPGPGLPGAPRELETTISNRSVVFQWQEPIDGGSPSGYSLEVASRSDFVGSSAVALGLVNQLHVPEMPLGVHFARVRATNEHGQSPPSNVEELTVGVPGVPVLTVQSQTNPITISWAAGPGAPPDEYVLSGGSAPGQSDFGIVSMGTATSLVAHVPAGVRIYLRVAAVNPVASVRSNEVSFVLGESAPGPGGQPPSAPTLAPALVNGQRVTLSWAAGPGGAPSTYILLVGTSSGSSNIGSFPLGGTTTITADSPLVGTLHARVIAQNSAGSATSNPISFAIGQPVQLPAPTMHQPVISGSTVRLSWSGVGSASSYVLVGRAAPKGPVIATLPVTALSAEIPGVPPGTYFVSVVARNGQQTSAESNAVTVSVP